MHHSVQFKIFADKKKKTRMKRTMLLVTKILTLVTNSINFLYYNKVQRSQQTSVLKKSQALISFFY